MPTRKNPHGHFKTVYRHFSLAKQKFQSPKVNFIANNLRLFACFLNSNCYSNMSLGMTVACGHHSQV